MSIFIENQILTEISVEESALVRGGGIITAAAYYTVITALNPALINDPNVINTVFLFLINALPAPESFFTP
ncbi:hypothetical protein CLI64_27710 [Nostoc sp. CENA543]|uniref:hypothetical protein n=1 Tax=Nostoc sp. CENA543 TaxID=1869241 RepID=UPI000CA22535|nr:hypothetical protein [Nostoc sp. CENA543]AUT03874.1 hypothetical protein CLI64_27710 [Nostoc sp. CENA543]